MIEIIFGIVFFIWMISMHDKVKKEAVESAESWTDEDVNQEHSTLKRQTSSKIKKESIKKNTKVQKDIVKSNKVPLNTFTQNRGPYSITEEEYEETTKVPKMVSKVNKKPMVPVIAKTKETCFGYDVPIFLSTVDTKALLEKIRNKEINKKFPINDSCILSDVMITEFIKHKPTNIKEFTNKIALNFREKIDINQTKYLDCIFEILESNELLD